MFFEDLRTHALPYQSTPGGGFVLEVQPADTAVTQLIADALPTTGYGHGMLDDSFRDYMESALWHLGEGELHLEIEYFRTDENATSPTAFQIHILEPELVARRLGRYRYRARHVDSQGQSRTVDEPIDADTLVVARLPKSLRRQLNRTLAAIRASDDDILVMSDFTLGKHGQDSGFNFTVFQQMTSDIVLRATRETGWTGRSIYTEHCLDPQKAWRAIQFERLVATLREAALLGLNEAISRAGVKLGFTALLALSGVRKAQELDQMERDLDSGTRSMADLLSPGL
ncbi:hypothetical protein [Demequina aurantiaca]|uniref:hypothetical protein n=1 Tax=Demequina aurantiaca TaxID=676200 RepID=UPI003D35657D